MSCTAKFLCDKSDEQMSSNESQIRRTKCSGVIYKIRNLIVMLSRSLGYWAVTEITIHGPHL